MGGKRHSEDLKLAVINYWQNNPDVSYRKISETFSMAQNTIRNLVKKFKKRGTVANDTSKHKLKSTSANKIH